jgi:hypothetical protein
MGREIRRVPANWEHPKETRYSPLLGRNEESFKPLLNKSYDSAAREWFEGCIAWSNGSHPDQAESQYARECKYYWEYEGNPPVKDCHIPYDSNDQGLCTWWQAYETVSEGTPVSPAFATAEELIDYLSAHGDFWEQSRAAEGHRPVRPSSRETVRKFVESGHAFSMAVTVSADGRARVLEGIDTVDL